MARLILIDETYQIPNKFSRTTFYALAAVSLDREVAAQTRSHLRSLIVDQYWHSTENLRSVAGRQMFEEILRLISHTSTQRLYVVDQIKPNDKLGEVARKRLLRRLLTDLTGEFVDLGNLIRYEKRFPDYAAAADLRTIEEMKNGGLISKQIEDHPASPREENLLWLPDCVATAFRQSMVRNEPKYMKLIAKSAQIVTLKS